MPKNEESVDCTNCGAELTKSHTFCWACHVPTALGKKLDARARGAPVEADEGEKHEGGGQA